MIFFIIFKIILMWKLIHGNQLIFKIKIKQKLEQLHLVLEKSAAKGADQVSLINHQVSLKGKIKNEFISFQEFF